MEVELLYLNGEPASVEAPNYVELPITQTDPGLRGDTAQGGTKPATLETGVIDPGAAVHRAGRARQGRHAQRRVPLAAPSAPARGTGRAHASAADRHHRHHPARRPPVAVGDAHAHAGHAAHPRGAGRGGLPLARVLGRRHLRRLPALPRRRPLGAPARHQEPRACARRCRCCCAARTWSATGTTATTSCAASCYKAAENGIDIFRVFDALNDIRNFETAAAAIKETGKHFQAAVVYTISPVHSLDHYLEVARRLVDMGADSICIKDMAALLVALLRRAAHHAASRPRSRVPIQLHCHYIGGLAPMTYLKAIEAGVDVIDTATVPLAFGNSQPATEMVVTALIGTPYDSELDLEKLFAIAKYFETVRIEGGWDRGVTSLTHMQVYSHQVPGGMISNLESQLKRAERPRPPARGPRGDPRGARRGRLSAAGHADVSRSSARRRCSTCSPGKRWHIVPDEMKAYLRGRYGAAPGPVSAEIVERVLGDEQPITVRPAELGRRDPRGLPRRDRRPGALRGGRPVATRCSRRRRAPTWSATASGPRPTCSARRCQTT